ncbi:MAG: DMT family transporter [Rhodospirillales bacterium]|nr:DMT family transporter [Rhodospirillales bacterium]
MSEETAVPSPGGTNDRIGLGIALMVGSLCLFVSMVALIKHLILSGYSTFQILFFRNAVAFIPIGLLVMQQGGIASLATKRPWGHLLRSLIGLIAMGGFFYSLNTLALSDLVAISFAAPLFMTALSVPLLKEKVGMRRWAAVIVGFIGVLIMVKPTGSIELASFIALGATLFYALALIAVRNLSKSETSAAIVFYFTLIGTVISAVLMLSHWETPDLRGLLLLVAVGLVGGTAQIVMTSAIKAAPIAILAPFEYTALLWASGFDIIIWNVFPAANTLWGALIVAATGLYIVHRETRLNTRARFPARFTRVRVSSVERDKS